jgi:hypothetical protein
MSSHDGPSLEKVAWHQFVLQHQQFVARQFDQSRVDDEFVSGFLNGRRTRSLAPCFAFTGSSAGQSVGSASRD